MSLGALVILGGFWLGNIVYDQGTPDWYINAVLALGLPLLVVGCFFVMARRELPRLGLSSIKGKYAVIRGALGFIILCSAEIYIVYLLFFGAK